MVRNLSGGGNAKRQARKHQGGNSNTNVLRRSQCELEKYAIVRKLSGGSICVVMDEDGNELNCHMGGKFRGRNKRQNIVEKGKWLLVGLREWEKTHKNCDLEYVYERDEIEELKSLPGMNLRLLINEENVLNNLGIAVGSDVNDIEEELGFKFSDNVVSKSDINNIISGNVGNTVITANEEINIDDL
jgi:translation initiation factor IF-1